MIHHTTKRIPRTGHNIEVTVSMMTVGLDRRLPILRDQELLTSIDGSLAALRDRQPSADSVEKVGYGFHGRKVRA